MDKDEQQLKTLLNLHLKQADKAVLIALQTQAALSEVYQHQLTVVSPTAIQQSKLIGQPLKGYLNAVYKNKHSAQNTPRLLTGFVNRIQLIESQYTSHYHYKVDVTPGIWRLSLTKNCRVFQEVTVLDILNTLLKENGLNLDYQVRFMNALKPIDYVVQFNETDLQFITRLLTAAGFLYYFDEQADEKQLILTEDNAGFIKLADAIQYKQSNNHCCLYDWEPKYSVAVNSITAIDHHIDSPRIISSQYSSDATQQAPKKPQDQKSLDLQYPGQFTDDAAARQQTKRLMLQKMTTSQGISAKTQLAYLTPGKYFDLNAHYSAQFDDKFFIHKQWQVVTDYTGLPYANNQIKEDQKPQSYQNSLVAHSQKNAFQSMLMPKAKIPGALIATVVGAKGSEVDADALGRVYIQFPWDRTSPGFDKASKRVRVRQIWAGKNHGHLWIPRIGQEVLVVFENGDIDRPLVWAAIHNKARTPVYGYESNNLRIGIRSNTLSSNGKSGSNELSFDDNKNNLQIFIHAQKDCTETAHTDYQEEIQQGQSSVISLTGDYHVKAKRILLDAAGGIDLKVDGGNYIKIASDGIHLQGVQVELNGG